MSELTTEQKRARKLLPFVILLLILGFVIIRWGLPAYDAFIKKQERIIALRIHFGILAALGSSGLAIGLYGFRLSRRMLITSQLPSRIKDFVNSSDLQEDELARRTGRLYHFMSWVLVLCSFGMVTMSYMLYRSVADR